MAHGKKRRKVMWRSLNGVAHAFILPRMVSQCRAVEMVGTDNADKEEQCRQCEISLQQLW